MRSWRGWNWGDGNFGGSGLQPLEWLSQISPAHYANINFRGTLSFAVNEYAEWLLSEPLRTRARK